MHTNLLPSNQILPKLYVYVYCVYACVVCMCCVCTCALVYLHVSQIRSACTLICCIATNYTCLCVCTPIGVVCVLCLSVSTERMFLYINLLHSNQLHDCVYRIANILPNRKYLGLCTVSRLLTSLS